MPIIGAVIAAAGLVAVVAPTDGRADATASTCTHGVSATNALGPATGWTEFVEGNANRHDSESEGLAAYGGNLSNNGNWNQVAFKLTSAAVPAATPTLVVGGTNSANVHLHVGSAYVGTKVGTVDFQGGGGYLSTNPVDVATAFTQLRALSTSWAAATQTGTVVQGGDSANHRLVLTGANTDLDVFTISAADVAWASAAIQIDVPAGATTIINVTGTSVAFGGSTQKIEGKVGGSFQGLDDGNFSGFTGLVWNFPTATSVSLNNGGAFAGAMLAPNAAVTVGDNVGHNTGQVIAKSFDSNRETHLPLFQSTSCVPGTPAPPTPPANPSDIAITKTASVASPHGGDHLTYTLKAENVGDSDATGVVVTDALPAGVTFLSATSPCTQSGGTVRCSLGTVAAHASTTVTVTVVANPIAGAGPVSQPQAYHELTPYHLEQQVDLEAGEQKTVTLSCNAGDILGDGQFRIDHVDQDTGTIAQSVKVLSSQADGPGVGTWKGVIRNNATGRAQAKAFITCVPGQTEAATRQTGYNDSHRHTISANTTPVTTTAAYAVGRTSTTLTCPTGTIPVAPGFSAVGGGATLAGSEYDASHPQAWTFTVAASVPATVTLSMNCLHTTTSAVYGHTHELLFKHVVQTVTVAGHTAAEGDELQVSCPDDAKGIVGTWSLPAGVQSFGNDPRIKTRAFRLYNDSGVAQTATVDLLCLYDRTGLEDMGTTAPVSVVNTATVTSTSTDANPLNNSSSATIAVQPGAATVAAASSVHVSASAVALRFVSSMPGTGAVTVRSGGAVLAHGRVKLVAGEATSGSVKLTKAGKRTLAGLDTVTVKVDPTRGKAVTRSVQVVHP